MLFATDEVYRLDVLGCDKVGCCACAERRASLKTWTPADSSFQQADSGACNSCQMRQMCMQQSVKSKYGPIK